MAGSNQMDPVMALSGLLNGRSIDSRAQSVASNVQGAQQQMSVGSAQQAQQQQQAASGVLSRNRMLEVDQQGNQHDEPPDDYYIADLYAQLTQVILAKPTEVEPLRSDDAEDPACVPMLWISKWVDYSDKYGLGYQLCDESVGVLFNDSTRLILCSSGENLQYIERDGNEFLYTLQSYPDWLQKKVTLLKYFRDYMSQHLLKAGATIAPRPGDEMSRLPFLRTWLRTRNAIILHLSNGTLQVTFQVSIFFQMF